MRLIEKPGLAAAKEKKTMHTGIVPCKSLQFTIKSIVVNLESTLDNTILLKRISNILNEVQHVKIID